MSNLFGITLAQDGFCIASTQVKILARLCHCVMATLVGQGFEVRRKFAVLDIDDQIYLADTVTGMLFNLAGEHHTEINLRVKDIPAIKPSWAKEVRHGGRN